MSICGKCNQPIRWDESLSYRHVPGVGGCYCCERCCAELDGVPVPEPKRYPQGCRMPFKPDTHPAQGAVIPICGLCRVALPWGVDRGSHTRIREEMLLVGENVVVGGYVMGECCLKKWRPRVAAYLRRLCRDCNTLDCSIEGHVRHLAAGASDRIGGNMLM